MLQSLDSELQTWLKTISPWGLLPLLGWYHTDNNNNKKKTVLKLIVLPWFSLSREGLSCSLCHSQNQGRSVSAHQQEDSLLTTGSLVIPKHSMYLCPNKSQTWDIFKCLLYHPLWKKLCLIPWLSSLCARHGKNLPLHCPVLFHRLHKVNIPMKQEN